MRLTALSLSTILCLTATVFGDEFRDFRVPTHRVRNAAASFYGWYRHDKMGSDGSYPGGVNENLDLTGRLAGVWLHDSDARRLRIFGAGDLSGDRSESEQVDAAFQDRNRNRRVREFIQASADYRLYPWSHAFGLAGTASGSAFFLQSWYTEKYRNPVYTMNRDTERWQYEYRARGDVQVGYGRVRDASGVFEARLMEQRLRETGMINGSLPAETLRKLAELHYRRSDYKLLHERPSRAYWKDVETILQESGSLGVEGLDAYNLYRLAEGLGATAYNSFIRERGYFVGPALRAEHAHFLTRYDESRHEVLRSDSGTVIYDTTFHTADPHDQWGDQALLGVKSELHLPWGLRWQLDWESSALFSLNDTVDGFSVETDASLRYVLADRWSTALAFEQTRTISQSGYGGVSDQWNVWAGASLRYFIEDRLSAAYSIWHQQQDQVSSPFQRSTYMSLGLTYGLPSLAGSGGGEFPRDGEFHP